MDDTIGVDISKPTLDAFRLRTREHRQFPNDRAGCAALIRWIGASAVRVIFEPTGPYHRIFEASLVAADIEAVKVNPRSSRRFAEATGELAKTDRIDAAILSRMGAVLDLEGRPAKSESLHDLRELGVARQALVKDRIAATNREQIAVNPVIKRQLRARLKQIGIQLKEIDAAIATLSTPTRACPAAGTYWLPFPASEPSPPWRS
jgi:transposase